MSNIPNKIATLRSDEDHRSNRVQDQTNTLINQVRSVIILNGLVVSANLLTGQDNLVSHKLSRRAEGFIIIKKDANADIWLSADDDNQFVLQCDADVNASFWVF